jgi:hypothetical protein
MPIAEAHVATDRPGRYLVQLCRHFSNKGRHLGHRPRTHHGGDASAGAHTPSEIRPEKISVEWSDTHGVLSLPWGRCTLQATPGTLTLHVEATDEENLRRLQDLATAHINRFSRRDPLSVDWRRSEEPAVRPDETARTPSGPGGEAPAARPWHRRWPGIAAVGAVVVGVTVHLGLGGAVLADTRWTGWAIGFVVAAILVKVAVVGGLAVRHRRRRTG